MSQTLTQLRQHKRIPIHTNKCASTAAAHTHFHSITSLVCNDTDKTVVTEMSDGGRNGGFEIEQEIMYFN